MTASRECGPCQACCELPLVRELSKPMWTRCAHQCEAGCSDYEARPAACRAFVCAWLRGDAILTDDDRPDRLGLMLETCVSTAEGGAEVPYVHAWETRPGAFEAPGGARARALVQRVAKVHAVKLRPYGRPAVYHPQGPGARADLLERIRVLRRRAAAAPPEDAEPDAPCLCGSRKSFATCHGAKP